MEPKRYIATLTTHTNINVVKQNLQDVGASKVSEFVDDPHEKKVAFDADECTLESVEALGLFGAIKEQAHA